MAKQRTVTLIDDLDGGEATEQVLFALDGRWYEIDLSAENSAKLRGMLAPYISAARRRSGRRPSYARAASNREHNQSIREWAVTQGMKISDRGRIPSSVLEAYRESH